MTQLPNKFAEWIKKQGGPPRVAKLLGVTSHAVRVWVRSEGTPKTKTIVQIMLLSKLSFTDIVGLKKKSKRNSS